MQDKQLLSFRGMHGDRASGCASSSSESSRPDNVHAHLAGVGGLQLQLDALQLPLEPVLGARVQHLASHPRCIRGPAESLMKKRTNPDSVFKVCCLAHSISFLCMGHTEI